jgi:hypothetical protein
MRAYRTVGLLFSLSLIWLPGSTLTANAQRFAYCKADAARLCPGVRPGGSGLAKCLKEHKDEVSIGCAKELKQLKSEMGK